MQEKPMNPRSAETTTAGEVAAAIVRAMPRFEEDERRLATAIYRGLAEARPVRLTEAAERAGLGESRVRQIVDGMSGVYRDDAGDIIGFWGLALEKMPHRLEVDGREVTTWCAWDPLFIVPLLGVDGRVRSNDPRSGQEVSLTVSAGGVSQIDPIGAVVSFRVPDASWDDTVVHSFCHYVLYFTSRESGQRWVDDHPGTLLLSVEDAFEVGLEVAREVFGLQG